MSVYTAYLCNSSRMKMTGCMNERYVIRTKSIIFSLEMRCPKEEPDSVNPPQSILVEVAKKLTVLSKLIPLKDKL